LKASDVGLAFLTGELQGSHDPSGVVFTVRDMAKRLAITTGTP
jgi:hypothetical protein